MKQESQIIVSDEEAAAKARKLPSWVKCMICGERPRTNDWLIDLMSTQQGMQSNALIHQSCARGQGKVAGLNA